MIDDADSGWAEQVRKNAACLRELGLPPKQPVRPWRNGPAAARRRPRVRVRTYFPGGGNHRRHLCPTEYVLRRLIVGELHEKGVRGVSSSRGVYRARMRALIAVLAGTGCTLRHVLRLEVQDLLKYHLPVFLWEPVVQWLTLRHRHGLRDGLVFCALRRLQFGLRLDRRDVRRRFLRHQAWALNGFTYTLSGISAMHRNLMRDRRAVPLIPFLVRHLRRSAAREDLVHYLSGLQGRLASSSGC